MKQQTTIAPNDIRSSEFDTVGFETRQIDELINQVVSSDISGDTEAFNDSNDRLLDELIEISESNDLPVSGDGPSQEQLLTSVIKAIDLKKLEVAESIKEESQNASESFSTSRGHRVSREDARKALQEARNREQEQKDPRLEPNVDDHGSRIDEKLNSDWLATMTEAGVPKEIIEEFPLEFFLRDSDPERINDLPDNFEEWLRDNPYGEALFIKAGLTEMPEKRQIRRWEKFDSKGAQKAHQKANKEIQLIKEALTLLDGEGKKIPNRVEKLKDRVNNPAVEFLADGSTKVNEVGDYNLMARATMLALNVPEKIKDNKGKTVLAAALGVAAVFAAWKFGFSPGGGGSDKFSAAGEAIPLPSKSSVNTPEVNQAIEWISKVEPGDGVSQVASSWFEPQGINTTPERMKALVDTLIDKDLFNPENISGLEKMNVYGDYGFASTGNTKFSPAVVEEMNRLKELWEEADKAKS